MPKTIITYSDFEKIDIRTGTILEALIFEKVKKPAYQLIIDFGDFGIKKSSAQITDLYTCEDLVGKQIIAIVNFPPKQIANFMSECLVLGITNLDGKVILLKPDLPSENGLPIS